MPGARRNEDWRFCRVRENWADVVADSKAKKEGLKGRGLLLGKAQIPAYPGFAHSEVPEQVCEKGTNAGRQSR